VAFAEIAVASDAVIAYASNGSAAPRLRFWNSSGSGSWGSEIPLAGAASYVYYAVIKASPVSEKMVLVISDGGGSLHGYVCMSNCNVSGNWNLTSGIGTVTDAGVRSFDVEFETSTGDAILVYAISSSNGARDLAYKILPNATRNFSAASTVYYINDSGHGGGGDDVDYSWVRLDRKPTTSEELILTAFDSDNNDINAWVWNGSVWNNQTEISSTATDTNSDEALAVRYAANGSKGMVVGANGSSGAVAYKFWSSGAWSSAASTDMIPGTDDVRWLNLKADPATDDLQLVLADSVNDLHTAYWNGSTWAVTNDIETDLATSIAGDVRPADFEWNPSGSTGRLVWDNDSTTGTTMRQRACSPQCTGAISVISSYNNETRFITLYRNPTVADTVDLLGARLMMPGGSLFNLGSFSFDGASYSNYGDTSITPTALFAVYESYSIAFLTSATSAITSCQNISASGVYALGDDLTGAGIDSGPQYSSYSTCIRISASDVTLNCMGHSLSADGSNQIGIYSDGFSNLTITNCTVDGDDNYNTYGIVLYEVYDSNLSYNTIDNTRWGIYLDSSDYNYLLYNNFSSNDYSIYIWESDHNQMGHNLLDSTSNMGIGGSCPFLYLWDGEEYDYYTDLAGESLGGSSFETGLYEAGIYELGNFKSEDGTYRMKIREVIPESDFVDELKLAVVDVPEGYDVLNQWHNTYSDDEAPPKDFMTIKDPKAPVSATDKYGNDVLAEVSGKDGVPLPMDGNEPNSVIVDFGSIDNPQYAKLVITGWVAYGTDAESPYQKNLKIETMNADGEWEEAKQFGKFTGDSRTFVFDISGILKADDTRMRISTAYSRTNTNILDQVLLDDSEPVDIEVTYIEPSVADLRWGGSTSFEYGNTEHPHIVTDEQLPNNERFLMYGNFTKYGDVKPLLEDADDMFAIMRHGDELGLEFQDIAPVDGMDRHVFLQADVMYSIKYTTSRFVTDSIEPMPFHGMSNYPYGENESYPYDEEHLDYISTWNTREYAPDPSAGLSLPYSENNTVFENTITGDLSSTGIYLLWETDTKILDNNISDVWRGVYLYYSSGTVISGNNISNTDQDGVYLYESDGSNISWNSFSNNNYGVRLSYSDFNTLLDNNFTDSVYGFYLDYSDHNQIGRNRILDTQNGNFGSCPFLFLWNGSAFDYYTDVAGEPLGIPLFKTQKYESGIYELGDFKSDEGTYSLKLREVAPESDYVDEMKLIAVDVPEGYSVLNTWSYTYLNNQAPEKGFMTIHEPISPVAATDSYGNDVLAQVSEKDGVPVPTYDKTMNPIVLDFGEIENPQYAKLIMTGWAAYEFNPDSPVQEYLLLETMGPDGAWTASKTFGHFIGDSRTLVFDISDVLKQNDTRMRITAGHSKYEVHLVDQVLLDDSEPVDFSVTYLEPSTAELRWGGSTPYEYATTEHRHIGVRDEQHPDDVDALMYGSFTKYGDVGPLLAEADDMFAVMRHGDELLLEFEDIPQDEGTSRVVFLEADVMYPIKYSIKGFVRETIEPMPFHGMSKYPYGEDEAYPGDAEHQEYVSTWNTREYAAEPSAGMSLPYSVNNTVFENVIIGTGSGAGFSLEHEDGTKLLNNNISDVGTGIIISSSLDTLVSGNNITGSAYHGINQWGSNDTTISDNVVSDSGEVGLYVRDSPNTRVSRDRYYNNAIDVEAYAENVGFSFYLEEVMFDNDAGLPENFTNLSLSDDLAIGENYTLDWATEPDTPPGQSFAQKYIEITGLGGAPSIDTVIWHWLEDELTTPEINYTEDKLGIMEYDGARWLRVASTLDTDANTVTVTDLSGFSTFAVLEVPREADNDNDGGEQKDPLSLSLASTCDANVVTVESKGDALAGATVVVNGDSIGTTNSSGQIAFEGCGMYGAIVRVSKSGYQTEYISADTASCEECEAAGCADDSSCPASEECTDGKCSAVKCDCGKVANHQCVEYACCSDSGCATGEICSNHVCVEPSECTGNADCASEEYCDMAAGICRDVTGQCGRVVDHAFVSYGYECGTEPGCPTCPESSACKDHKCIQYSISCPTTGTVSEQKTCTVTENGQPCVSCDYTVTDPSGKKVTGKTDEDGNLVLSLNLPGTYKVAVTEDGQVVKELSVKAAAKPPPQAVQPPSAAGPDYSMLIVGGLILLVLLVLGFLYFGRKKKQPQKPQPKKYSAPPKPGS